MFCRTENYKKQNNFFKTKLLVGLIFLKRDRVENRKGMITVIKTRYAKRADVLSWWILFVFSEWDCFLYEFYSSCMSYIVVFKKLLPVCSSWNILYSTEFTFPRVSLCIVTLPTKSQREFDAFVDIAYDFWISVCLFEQ